MIPGPAMGPLPPEDRRRLLAELAISRELGFLGPGDLKGQLAHSTAFAPLVPDGSGPALDLGSGGGLPGLVLAILVRRRPWLLLDANHRRTAYLEEAVKRLGLHGRVTVRCDRAEVVGRGPERGTFDVVVARGFAGPAATAECAAPLLRVGGFLVVAEPPAAPERWPVEPLRSLGLEVDVVQAQPVALRRFRQVGPCPERYPRRVGVPEKRPLFGGR